MAYPIKRGDFVEFTDDWYQHYPPQDKSVIKYGICVADADMDKPFKVRTVRGIEIARHVHAAKWIGWIPEDLEEIYIQEFQESCYNSGIDDY